MRILKKLGHSVKQIFTELGEVYGSDKICYETIRKWRHKFLKDAAKSGRPVIVTGQRKV